MSLALDHIEHKLERAQEHIQELHRDVEAFLNEAPHRTVANYSPESLKAFIAFHSNRPIPPRLGVVAGDAVHQLRSSLDHLLCALIRRECNTPSKRSQFPIWDRTPTTSGDKAAYKKQVEGIGRAEVLDAIERLQPYNTTRPLNSWLRILNMLSNTDKHNALILTVTWLLKGISVEMEIPDPVTGHVEWRITSGGPDEGTDVPQSWIDPSGDRVEVLNVQRSISALVAFDQWGDASMGPIRVVEGITALHEGVTKVVSDFSAFF